MRAIKLAVYFIAKTLGLFKVSRRLTAKNPKIICYHGLEVDNESQFRPRLFMTAKTFAKRMRMLHRLGYKVISLDRMVKDMLEGKDICDTVTITFDDGFSSFRTIAAPILRSYSFPSTVYVTTYYVENSTPVFRILIHYLIWQAEPQRIDLTHLSGSLGHYDLASELDRDLLANTIVRHGELNCDEPGRVKLSAGLAESIGIDIVDMLSKRQFHLMQPDQLAELKDFQVDIGLHTHRHRFSVLDRDSAMKEISDNRNYLKSVGLSHVEHFCYPSGLYTSEQWQWLNELGVASSTTCKPGLNSTDTPRHELRRFLDGEDVYQIEFEAALCGFSDLLLTFSRRV